MFSHPANKFLPKLLPAFLVNAFISDDGEFLDARRDKNQHGVAFPSFLHPELQKFLLGALQGVLLEFAALEKDADLPGGLRFRLLDRSNDPIVLEFAKKIVGAHSNYQLPLDPPPPKLPPPPLNPLNPPDEDDEELPLDHPLLMNGPPNPV
jgi:hypothetical protein